MALSTAFRFVATGLAMLGAMLSFTMLLARYNGAVDKEYPILLSEYFEVNTKRNSAVVDFDQTAAIASVQQEFMDAWSQFSGLSTLLALPETGLEAEKTRATTGIKLTLNATGGVAPTLGNPYYPDFAKAVMGNQTISAIIDAANGANIGTGPIKPGFDIYNEDFQALLKALKVEEKYIFDAESKEITRSYFGLESTLGYFALYAPFPPPTAPATGADLTTTAYQAAVEVVSKNIIEADRLFEKIRIQTRVAVAASVVSIVGFCVALTILLVEKKTWALVGLNVAALLGGLLFLIMIQLNSMRSNDLLRLAFDPIPEGNAGPAVFAAGFALATGLVGAVVSGLFVRFGNDESESKGDHEDEEEGITMDEIKSEEAVKAEL